MKLPFFSRNRSLRVHLTFTVVEIQVFGESCTREAVFAGLVEDCHRKVIGDAFEVEIFRVVRREVLKVPLDVDYGELFGILADKGPIIDL